MATIQIGTMVWKAWTTAATSSSADCDEYLDQTASTAASWSGWNNAVEVNFASPAQETASQRSSRDREAKERERKREQATPEPLASDD